MRHLASPLSPRIQYGALLLACMASPASASPILDSPILATFEKFAPYTGSAKLGTSVSASGGVGWRTPAPRLRVGLLPDCCGSVESPRGSRRPRRQSDRKSTRLNSSHVAISYAVFCLKKKRTKNKQNSTT